MLRSWLHHLFDDTLPWGVAMSRSSELSLEHTDFFIERHIGPSATDVDAMLKTLRLNSLTELVESTVPKGIRLKKDLELGKPRSEYELLDELKEVASQNKVYRSYIGMGYYDTITPPVIQRNILENPGWYTQYTPYQSEIAQGRLEALLNFQTMVMDLTSLEIANASLLDEGTAAAEAMAMCFGLKNRDFSKAFFVSELCHPQTIEVVRTRAESLGIRVLVGDHREFDFSTPVFAALVQYPATDGTVFNYESFAQTAHSRDCMVIAAADLMSLLILKSPGEWGADIAIGNTQRFGVPMGFGGPHAAYLATKDAFKRQLAGRLVGVSKDSQGKPAIRLALQTREQHIRRDKATSNICTAQVLLAIMASMYAVYHGPKRLKKIAERIHLMTGLLAKGLEELGFKTQSTFFDTLKITVGKDKQASILAQARTI